MGWEDRLTSIQPSIQQNATNITNNFYLNNCCHKKKKSSYKPTEVEEVEYGSMYGDMSHSELMEYIEQSRINNHDMKYLRHCMQQDGIDEAYLDEAYSTVESKKIPTIQPIQLSFDIKKELRRLERNELKKIKNKQKEIARVQENKRFLLEQSNLRETLVDRFMTNDKKEIIEVEVIKKPTTKEAPARTSKRTVSQEEMDALTLDYNKALESLYENNNSINLENTKLAHSKIEEAYVYTPARRGKTYHNQSSERHKEKEKEFSMVMAGNLRKETWENRLIK